MCEEEQRRHSIIWLELPDEDRPIGLLMMQHENVKETHVAMFTAQKDNPVPWLVTDWTWALNGDGGIVAGFSAAYANERPSFVGALLELTYALVYFLQKQYLGE